MRPLVHHDDVANPALDDCGDDCLGLFLVDSASLEVLQCFAVAGALVGLLVFREEHLGLCLFRVLDGLLCVALYGDGSVCPCGFRLLLCAFGLGLGSSFRFGGRLCVGFRLFLCSFGFFRLALGFIGFRLRLGCFFRELAVAFGFFGFQAFEFTLFLFGLAGLIVPISNASFIIA